MAADGAVGGGVWTTGLSAICGGGGGGTVVAIVAASGVGGGGAAGGFAGGCGGAMSAVFWGVEVGPVVCRGNAMVAGYDSMIVAFGSVSSRLVDFSEAGVRSADVARIVAFGSNVCGAISKPPSKVQNFCPSSGNVRLHFGQLFIHETS